MSTDGSISVGTLLLPIIGTLLIIILVFVVSHHFSIGRQNELYNRPYYFPHGAQAPTCEQQQVMAAYYMLGQHLMEKQYPPMPAAPQQPYPPQYFQAHQTAAALRK